MAGPINLELLAKLRGVPVGAGKAGEEPSKDKMQERLAMLQRFAASIEAKNSGSPEDTEKVKKAMEMTKKMMGLSSPASPTAPEKMSKAMAQMSPDAINTLKMALSASQDEEGPLPEEEKRDTKLVCYKSLTSFLLSAKVESKRHPEVTTILVGGNAGDLSAYPIRVLTAPTPIPGPSHVYILADPEEFLPHAEILRAIANPLEIRLLVMTKKLPRPSRGTVQTVIKKHDAVRMAMQKAGGPDLGLVQPYEEETVHRFSYQAATEEMVKYTINCLFETKEWTPEEEKVTTFHLNARDERLDNRVIIGDAKVESLTRPEDQTWVIRSLLGVLGVDSPGKTFGAHALSLACVWLQRHDAAAVFDYEMPLPGNNSQALMVLDLVFQDYFAIRVVEKEIKKKKKVYSLVLG